jgi:hypothetical protein
MEVVPEAHVVGLLLAQVLQGVPLPVPGGLLRVVFHPWGTIEIIFV